MPRLKLGDELLLNKSVFTTGEVAEVCNISQQTVIRCFDAGKLKGFEYLGRVFAAFRDALIQFMKSNNISLDALQVGKKRVLVVDDDPAIVEMLVEILERDGRFEVQTAATGFDAGMRTKEFRPDVIILDYMLPDINGNAVCRTIRADKSLADVKIIIVSGVVNPEDVEKLLECADDFLQKPFKIDQMVNRITELVSE